MREWLSLVSVVLVAGAAAGASGCGGTVETQATGGTGGTGGAGAAGGAGGTGGTAGTGGTGGAGGDVCPETPKDALCGGGLPDNDGLLCEYDTPPCPTLFLCSSSITHGGWLTRPPQADSPCNPPGQVCTYTDENFDSGQTTTWTATCSDSNTWMVEEEITGNGP